MSERLTTWGCRPRACEHVVCPPVSLSAMPQSVAFAPQLFYGDVIQRAEEARWGRGMAGIAPHERKSSFVINGGSHFVARCDIILQGIHFQKAIYDIHILFPARSYLEVSVHGRGRDGNGSFKVVADATCHPRGCPFEACILERREPCRM